MTNRNQTQKLAIGITVLSALGRLVPHAPNVTPLGGASLFAGSRIPNWLAYVLPVLVMAATDPFVGGYTWSSPVIYACFMLNVFIGRQMVRKVTAPRVGAAAFLCSAQFFVFTNLAVWARGVMVHSKYYTPDVAGLMTCYAAALPFWGKTLAGDLLFSAAIFGMYEVLVRKTAAHAISSQSAAI